MTVQVLETGRVAGLSRRAREMPSSPIRRLAPLAEAAKARGTRVLHLNIGQPDIETPACIRDRLRQIDTSVLAYSPSTGTPEFIRSLKRYYERRLGLSLRDDQLLATTGGSEAILFSFLACANEGDDVIVLEPYYANYKAFATMAGVNLVPVTSRGRDGFHPPRRATWERAIGITSTGSGNLPSTPTSFEPSAMQTNFRATAATIFSRVSAPPPPLTMARWRVTSSAPST